MIFKNIVVHATNFLPITGLIDFWTPRSAVKNSEPAWVLKMLLDLKIPLTVDRITQC